MEENKIKEEIVFPPVSEGLKGYTMGIATPANTAVSTSGYVNTILKKEFKIKRVDERAIIPEIKEGNVGIDLRVLTENNESEVIIEPKGFFKFRTGIKVEIPSGYYVEIVPRSSTGCKKNISLKNTVGVIDSSYRGEILVFVQNFGDVPIVILDNERLCQMIIHKDEATNFKIIEVNELSDTERGEGGFGSSGRM